MIMQIFFLSSGWTIALCFILWPIFQIASALICLKVPDKYFSPQGILFKERKWEKGGKLYEKVFKIKKWKRFLPDGGAAIKGGYKKRHLTNYSKENLERFMIETCRGELTHFIAILPFWIFGLFSPNIVILIMFIYAIIVNFPCVIAQRYNRHRIVRLFEKHYNNKTKK